MKERAYKSAKNIREHISEYIYLKNLYNINIDVIYEYDITYKPLFYYTYNNSHYVIIN